MTIYTSRCDGEGTAFQIAQSRGSGLTLASEEGPE